MGTDIKTLNYYTSGSYDINNLLSKERKDKLSYCSMIGISLSIRDSKIEISNDCINMEVVWPKIINLLSKK